MDEIVKINSERIGELIDKHRKHLIHICAKKTGGNVEETFDLVQDIMLHALQRRDEFIPLCDDSARKRWLFSVARSVIFRYNQGKRHRPVFTRLLPDQEFVDETAGYDSARSELMELARAALDADELKVLQMRIDGYTCGEMAAVKGCTDEALRKRFGRIIEKIQKYHNITVKKQ